MIRPAVRTAAVLLVAALLLPVALAQDGFTNSTRMAPPPGAGWHEQANEFGTAQALYQDMIDGQPRAFESRIWLNTNYRSKEATYFLFAMDAQRTPLRPTFDELVRADNGQPIPIFREDPPEAGGRLLKKWVDIANMPPPGTLIVVRGTIHGQGVGQYQAGAMAQVFNYRWEALAMASGLPAGLYIGTQYAVNRASEEGCNGKLCGIGQMVERVVPGPALAGLLVAAAFGAVATRRRR